MAARIQVSYAVSRRNLPAPVSFRRWVEATLKARRRREGDVSIRIVDATEGRELNRMYRGKDYATNVLSFPVELPAGVKLPLLGDLVLCAPVLASEALQQGKALRNHYAHLVVHGVLHLCGQHHETASDARAMEAMERQLLDSFGIHDPYRAL